LGIRRCGLLIFRDLVSQVCSYPWKGGVAAPSNKWSRSFEARPGMSRANVSPIGRNKEEWFVQRPIIGGLNLPPRLHPLRRLRGIFLMGAATPPFQGGEYALPVTILT